MLRVRVRAVGVVSLLTVLALVASACGSGAEEQQEPAPAFGNVFDSPTTSPDEPEVTDVQLIDQEGSPGEATVYWKSTGDGGSPICAVQAKVTQSVEVEDEVRTTTVGICETAVAAGYGQVAAGYSHTCAVAGGNASCWGRNQHGQVGTGDSDSPVLEPVEVEIAESPEVTGIAAGAAHTCAVAGGDVWCWGRNEYGALGTGGKGGRELEPVEVVIDEGLPEVTKIAAGYHHTCAVAGGDAWCWGKNNDGQVGTGDGRVTTPQKVEIAGSPVVTKIVAGEFHTCAVAGDDAWCWGRTTSGQVGTGNSVTPVLEPVEVEIADSVDVTGITANGSHTCAVAGGDVWCWGENIHGQVGTGDRETPVMMPKEFEVEEVELSFDGSGGTVVVAVAGLEYGEYTVQVRVENAVGWSEWSSRGFLLRPDLDTAAYTLSTTTASVTEAGSTATFTVVLDTQPLSDVVLTVVSADTGETTVSPATLTFTTANWDTTQTVTVTGVDDSIDDDNQDTTVTIAVDDDNSDNAFDGLADQTVTATTTDDDTVSTPGAPSAVLAVAGPQSALVTWEAPASDGGATVTTYQVDYSSDAAITWTTTATDATLSHAVEGLTAGGEYIFRVSATNSVGTGDASAASTTVTVGHSITVGYGDDLYAALLEAGDSIGDTSETFQRRAMAIADYYLDLLTYPDPIESAPDTSGPNTVTSTYTAAEYDDWVVGTATGFNVDETSGQYVASYLLVFLLTRVTR